MSKYVYIKTADNSAYMNTADNFRGAHHSADTVVDLYFNAAGSVVGGAFDKIVLTVTTEKEQEVMDNIGGALAGSHSKGMVVIADDVAGKYVNANITAVGAFQLAQTAATFKKPIESVTVDDSLTAAESGTTYVFADAAAVLTLPDSGAGDILGTTYTFISNFAPTGQEVKCADTTGEIMIGSILGVDQDGDGAPLAWDAQVSDAFSSIEFEAVAAGKIGSYFTVTNYAIDRWLIEGHAVQSGGSEATPFATS